MSGIEAQPINLLRGGDDARGKPQVVAGRARPGATRVSIGATPALALLAALGLILIAVGDNAARRGEGRPQLLFWGGLGLIYLPIAFRLFGDAARRPERIALVLTLGLSLFVVMVLRSPAEFVRFDELGWWRATHEVVVTGHTFSGNPLNPATAGYPALATVTAAVSQLTGLSIFHSGLIVIGIARAILMLALFLFLEEVIRSSRGASIGIVVYACNPSFLYFDAQFGYESLALMSAAAVLLASLRWSREERSAMRATAGLAGVLLVLTCGLTVTHHMTSLALLAFLALWVGARAILCRSDRASTECQTMGPLVPTLLLALTIAVWLSLVAGSVTIAELGGLFSRAFTSVADLISGNSGSKQLFSGTGQSVGVGNRALTFAYVVLTLILVLAGLRTMWQDRGRVREPLWLALSAVAMLYPVTLGLRLTLASSEVSERASEFVFLGVAFLAALLGARSRRPAWRSLAMVGARLALTAVATMSFIGSFLLGETQATRQPGSYLVGAEDRSITPEGIAAAAFAAADLPAKSRTLADRTNATLLGSYGGLNPVFGRYGSISLPRILFGSRFDETDRRALRGQSLALVVVDRRLSRERPLIGYYVESDEPGAFVRRRPASVSSLEKFASLADVSKIYTNGPIVIYDTTALLR